jgi:methyl-accepting chemotaxis protein
VVQAAKGDAETSGVIVRDAVQAMQAIEGSSDQISQIIGVIDEIAFQTNLLALNAGVEAARAGEAGRGFAVVATEVRNLAQRSATAAKEIKELIGESTSKVDAGTKLVDQAGQSMENVVTSFQQVTHLVTDIANASREQASGIEQVWLQAEEDYLGIDDLNRHEWVGARWSGISKGTTLDSPLRTSTHRSAVERDPTR